MAVSRNSRPVYSTDQGRLCPGCGQAVAACRCRTPSLTVDAGGPVYLSRETKGRKGAGVTLVSGVPLAAAELAVLAKRLKQVCGVGGAVKDGVIELQGDQRERIEPLLRAQGWPVRRKGG